MKKVLWSLFRPGRGQALAWGLILVVAALAGGADCANAQTAGVPLLRPETPPAASSSLANPGAGIGARRPETAALPPNPDQTLGASGLAQPLEIDDANRYRQIFDLQRQSRFREAELVMGWLNDHRLVGDVLAQRYLAGGYTASYRELASWLGRYGDHPQALRLYKLALKRRPVGAALPAKPEVDVYRRRHARRQCRSIRSSLAGGSCRLAQWQSRHRGNAIRTAAAAKDCGDWEISAAAYWAARAHLKNREPAKVSNWLRQAAQYSRTFYGQLARRALGLDPSFNWTAKPITDAGAQALALSSRGQRALALLQIGELALAEQEMQALLPSAGPDLASAVQTVAQLYQLPSLSLRLGVLAELQSNIHADVDLYPVPHWQPKGGFAVDRALLFAMARQESAFNVSADNASGAAGLMQLMPATAQSRAAAAARICTIPSSASLWARNTCAGCSPTRR